MNRLSLITGLTLSAITLLTATVSQAAPPEIRDNAVIFKGNNCIVYYRTNGTRRQANRNCRGRQVTRADRAMAAYRRHQGSNNRGDRHGRNVGRAIGAAIAIGLAIAVAKAANKHEGRCAATFRSCSRLHRIGTRRYDLCMHRRGC